MVYQDQTLICKDCGKNFIFTARDQDFFAQKGFTNAPTRCRDCRQKKKVTTDANANRVIYKITCKKCGKVGEMAVEPRKPNDVLCADCFYEDFQKEIKDKNLTPKEVVVEAGADLKEEPKEKEADEPASDTSASE